MSIAINKSKALIEAMFEVRKTPCAYDKTSYEEDKAFFNFFKFHKCLSLCKK